MVHAVCGERTVTHANERISRGEADRTSDEVRSDTAPAHAPNTTPNVAAISIADCVAPYRGTSAMPAPRNQTNPTVLTTENTAHQYAANLRATPVR